MIIMSFEIKTFEELMAELKMNLVLNVEEITDMNVGSVTDTIMSVFANSVSGVYEDLKNVYDMSRIDTATGESLDKLGEIVGVSRNLGSEAIGYVTLISDAPLLSDITILKDSRVSTQPNTTEEQLVFEVVENSTFRANVYNEEIYYISGTYEYALDERFINLINTLTDGITEFIYNTDYSLVKGYDGILIDAEDSVMFNNCDDKTDWSTSSESDVEDDAAVYYQGAGSIQLTKTGITDDEMIFEAEFSGGLDTIGKDLMCNLLINNQTTLDKIDSVTLEIASDPLYNNSLSITYDNEDLIHADNEDAEWNKLILSSRLGTIATTGNFDSGKATFFRLTIALTGTAIEVGIGELWLDNVRFSTWNYYEGDIIKFPWAVGDKPADEAVLEATYKPLSCEVFCQSVSIGSKYNVAADKIIYRVSNIPGVRTINNYEPFTDGLDKETDDSLRDRITGASELANVATVDAIRNNVLGLPFVRTCTVVDMPVERIVQEGSIFNEESPFIPLKHKAPINDANMFLYNVFSDLDGDVLFDDLTITLTDATGFPGVGGTIRIGDELITYTGVSTNDLTGCTRGTSGTTAVGHSNEDLVMLVSTWEKDVDYQYNDDGFKIIFLDNFPTDETIVYAHYDYNAVGFFEVYVTGTDGELSDTQITTVEETVDTVRSAGIDFDVLQPDYPLIDIEITFVLEDGFNQVTVERNITDNLGEYITGLDIGANVYKSKIISVINNTEGVYDVVISGTTLSLAAPGDTDAVIDANGNVIMPLTEKALPGAITYL